MFNALMIQLTSASLRSTRNEFDCPLMIIVLVSSADRFVHCTVQIQVIFRKLNYKYKFLLQYLPNRLLLKD